jgi:mannose-6-phosphate isomerase-like protein (cupin superfamily)
MTRAILKICAALLVLSAGAAAQTNDSAVYVTSEQIQAATKSMAFRIVDVGNAYVGVAIQHRAKAEAGKAGNPLVHSTVTEVYIVTQGSAKMATGGMMNKTGTWPADNKDNGEGIGLGFTGTVAKPNDVRSIKKGDVIIIPDGMPHWFTEVPEDLTYLVVRIDPAKTIVPK